jgi:hypothetical protein
MKRMTGSYCVALLALGLVAGTNAFAQDQEAIAKARKLRAEAAYQEMKGDRAGALKNYQESLKYVKDAAIEKKISALGVAPVAPAAGDDRAVAGEVYSRLDVGGELLVFVSPDSILKPVREELKIVMAAVKDSLPDGSGPGKVIAAQIDPALEWLGLYSIRGIGLSLARQGDGTYNYKEYWLGGDDRENGVLWRLSGKPVPQDLLAYLPEKTGAFAFNSVGIKSLWDIALEGIEKFAGAPAKDAVLQQVGGMKEALAVTLDDSTTISIPLPGDKALSIPEPGILIALDVVDGTILQSIRTFLEAQGTVLKETKSGDNTIYSFVLPEPLPVPVPVEPAMVLLDGSHLLFGLHPKTLEAAIASKAAGGALLKSADFKQAFADMPAKVNGVLYMGKLFSGTVADIQKLVLEAGPLAELEGANATAALLAKRSIEKLAARKDNRLALYSVSDADGVLTHCNSYSSGMNPIADAIVMPLGMISAMGINSAEKARQAALASRCMSNLYQLSAAKDMWAMEANAAEGAEVDMAKVNETLGNPLVCPKGGTYAIGKVGEKPSCTCGQALD